MPPHVKWRKKHWVRSCGKTPYREQKAEVKLRKVLLQNVAHIHQGHLHYSTNCAILAVDAMPRICKVFMPVRTVTLERSAGESFLDLDPYEWDYMPTNGCIKAACHAAGHLINMKPGTKHKTGLKVIVRRVYLSYHYLVSTGISGIKTILLDWLWTNSAIKYFQHAALSSTHLFLKKNKEASLEMSLQSGWRCHVCPKSIKHITLRVALCWESQNDPLARLGECHAVIHAVLSGLGWVGYQMREDQDMCSESMANSTCVKGSMLRCILDGEDRAN
jgi:hypothetical protein